MSLLPFITVRRGLQFLVAAVAALMLTGCSDDSDSSAPEPTATGAATTVTESAETTTVTIRADTIEGTRPQAYFAIDEVGVGKVSFVTLTNFTDLTQDLSGLVICQEAHCAALPARKVAQGKRIHVAVGEGVPGDSVTVDLPKFSPSDGEIAIYAAGDPADPKDIVSYFEWGSTPHDRTPEAVDAGLWRTGSFAPTAPNAVKLVRKVESGWWVFETG